MNSFLRSCSIAGRAVGNYLTGNPLCVSFEITHDCNARCRHCHRGGKADMIRATPAQFGEMYRSLKPPVVQVSGGEPLLRRDVDDIIRALKQPDGTPYIIFVTNAALLTKDRYMGLLETGVDVFSVSFDFPDERHDEFRGIPGLFGTIRDLATGVTGCKDGCKAITLNSVIHSENFRDLYRMSEVAREWGVTINFSPYTWLRTHDMSLVISEADMPEFHAIIARLIAFKKKYGTIRTTDSFFYDMAAFFGKESRPGCRAGERFLVVNPDATLSPCGLIMAEYKTKEELTREFSAHNTCAACNTSIRAATEKPFNNLLAGALMAMRG